MKVNIDILFIYLYVCGGQRTTNGSQFSPSTKWVPGVAHQVTSADEPSLQAHESEINSSHVHFCKVSSWKSFWNVHNLNLTWNSWKGSLWHKVKMTKACEQLFYLLSYCRGFILKKIYYLLLWVFWLHALYVCTPHSCYAIEARGHWTSGTGVLNICKLPCGYWELSPGPLPEQAIYCLLCLENMT